MADDELRMTDRLQERGLIDRYGFMLFALAGSAAILAAKQFFVPTWIIASAAMAIMVAYALIVNMGGTGKLRSDQAGDNCYYLGLIYTLTSLAFTIFTFNPGDTATTIVQGFGVALATTILGLVLRVFFNQSRVDLYEAEDTARLELAEAAGQLKTELSQMAIQFKDFSFGLQQSITEIRDEAQDSIHQTSTKSIETMSALADSVVATLSEQSDHLANNASELAKKTASVSRSLDRHSASIDKVAQAHETIAKDVVLIADASQSMKDGSDAVLAQAKSGQAIQSGTNELIMSVNDTATQLSKNTTTMLGIMSSLEQDFAVRLKDLEDGPKNVADKAFSAIAQAASSVEDAMKRLALAEEDAVRSVGEVTEGLLKTVKGHNQEMEHELSQSRENVTKVHSALVDMTNTLNEKIG